MQIKPDRPHRLMSMKRLNDILTTNGFKTEGIGFGTANERISTVGADYADSSKYPGFTVYIEGPPSLPLMQACFDEGRTYISDQVWERLKKYKLGDQDSCTRASVRAQLSGDLDEGESELASNLYGVNIWLGDGWKAELITSEIRSIDKVTLVLDNVLAAKEYITREQSQAITRQQAEVRHMKKIINP